MVGAYGNIGTDRVATHQTDLPLEYDLQLLMDNGITQRCFHRLLLLQRLIHDRRKDTEPAAGDGLGGRQRHIRMAQQHLWIIAGHRRIGNTGTCRDDGPVPAPQIIGPRDPFEQAAAIDIPRQRLKYTHQDKGKTVAPKPRHQIGTGSVEPPRNLLEHKITEAVAEGIINLPEPAQIDDHKGHALRPRLLGLKDLRNDVR